MTRFVKEGAFGFKDVPGGQYDPDCTHVILNLKEYEKLLQEKARLEQEARSTKYRAEREIGEAKQAARYTAQKAAEEAQQTVADIESALVAERAESAHQRELISNLLRIAKERANADRKLRPKKEHTGYVVVVSEEREYRYRSGRKWNKVKLRETVLQSPYTVDFSESEVKNQIERELFPKDAPWMIAKIGISGRYEGTYEEMIEDGSVDEEFLKRNILLMGQQRLRANFRSGYWELIFKHTKPLGVIPRDMRPS